MVAMMDTLAIYEQFRAALGDEKAKVFAQVLGKMIEEAKNAATKDDVQTLREAADASTARLEAALTNLAQAQARTEARVEELAQAQARTEARVEELAQAQARTEARLEELAQAQARTEARLDRLEETLQRLAEAQVRTEERLARLEQTVEKLAEVVKGLVIRTDRHEGTLLELRFRDRLPSYLGLYLRRAKVLQPADLLDAIEPRLDRADVEDFLRADILAEGAVDGRQTYVVGEVSYTAEANDVERAARRAALLRKADLPAVALVACEAAHPQTIAYAREQGVRIWADGVLVAERA